MYCFFSFTTWWKNLEDLYYTEWKKPDTKSIYVVHIWNSKKCKLNLLWWWKANYWFAKNWRWQDELLQRSMKQLLGLMDRLRFLIMVLILCLCTSVRTYKVVNFKWVQVIEQKSYLNKVLKMRSSFTPYLENYHRFTLSLIIINQFCIYTRTQYCSDYTLRRNLIADIHDMC